jgi:hypothetical protein
MPLVLYFFMQAVGCGLCETKGDEFERRGGKEKKKSQSFRGISLLQFTVSYSAAGRMARGSKRTVRQG